MKNLRCWLHLWFWLFALTASAQPDTLRGQVLSTFGEQPLPYVAIRLGSASPDYLTDAQGHFAIPVEPGGQYISFRLPGYRSVRAEAVPAAPLRVLLNALPPPARRAALPPNHPLLLKLLAGRARFDPLRAPFAYRSYSRFAIDTENADTLGRWRRRLQSYLPVRFQRGLNADQRVFLLETTARRTYRDRWHQREDVTGARATGVDHPSVLAYTAKVQPFSVYSDFLTIGPYRYVSPLAGEAYRRYRFAVVDTVRLATDTLLVVAFEPRTPLRLQRVTGLLYVRAADGRVRHAVVRPAGRQALAAEVRQTYADTLTTALPERASVVFTTDRLPVVDFTLRARLTTTFVPEPAPVALPARPVIRQIDPVAAARPEAFWERYRTYPLTQTDRETYAYFQRVGQLRGFQRWVQTGESIYYGQLRLGLLDVDLNRVFDINEYEGPRLGFGAHTNRFWREQLRLGAYLNYGTRDRAWKYGASATYALPTLRGATVETSFRQDVRETGSVRWAFDREQFSSERLRRFRVQRMDSVRRFSVGLSGEWLPNLYAGAWVGHERLQPTYDYQFRDTPVEALRYGTLRLAVRWSFREQFVATARDRFSLGTPYPEVWLTYTQGVPDDGSVRTRFRRWDARVQQTIEMVGVGTFSWQLRAGHLGGDVLPYPLLYNALGSFRPVGAITHNYFETMGYNAYSADRFLALFTSHRFGRLYEGNPLFQPDLTVSHNLGVGDVRHPAEHAGVSFLTFPKGYFETGAFVSDLFVFRLPGLRLGVGLGAFLRYGPAAEGQFAEDLFYKFAFRLQP